MISTAVATAAAFNLVCTGTLEEKSMLSEKTEPYSITYRIDLDSKKYCENECKALFDIDKVGPTQIILNEEKIDTPRERRSSSNFINRETGAHHILVTSGIGSRIMLLNWTGLCEKAEFAGFPKFETKF